MGIYLNPGKAAYEEAVNSEIFIDKSDMILYLNTVLKTKQKYVSVSRPRRFGKTMAADMICAYYDREANSRELFEKLSLSKAADADKAWDLYLGAFDVIRIVMTDFIKVGMSIDASLKKIETRVLDELNETYQNVKFDRNDFFTVWTGFIA